MVGVCVVKVVVVVAGAVVVAGVVVVDVVVLVEMILVVVRVNEIVAVVVVEIDVDSGMLPSVDPSTTLAKLSVAASDDGSTAVLTSESADFVAAMSLMGFKLIKR
jgi:hypothetical protein